MRKHVIIIFLLCILCSCERRYKTVATIGEGEYLFDEKLSSISQDIDGTVWVGTESGDVISFDDKRRIALDLGEDRIYKTAVEYSPQGDTLFWIAVRNAGLQCWRKQPSGKLEKISTYYIDYKQEHYSPYDFLFIGDQVFLATSQGLYYTYRSNPYPANPTYLSKAFVPKDKGEPYMIRNLCQYNDTLLLASTQEGVAAYDLKHNNTHFIYKGEKVNHVSAYKDTLFSVLQDFLLLQKADGRVIARIPTYYSPRSYYRVQGVHYLIGAEDMLISNNLHDFYHLPLRRRVPIRSSHIFLPDTLNNFSYLLTENAVWRIPHNIDVFKNSKHIKAACHDMDNIYYLTQQNELYKQNKQSKHAKWLYTFPANELIVWIDIAGNDLFFYNIDNQFKHITISDNWLKNMIFAASKQLFQSDTRITAAYLEREGEQVNTAYVAIQDRLLHINRSNKPDTVPALAQYYITAIFYQRETNRVYISTLNNGAFYLNNAGQVKALPGTENLNFITDIIATSDHASNLIMLTNQQIISQNPQDTIRVKGYKKLIYVNDTLFYALPEYGIRKFGISDRKISPGETFYRDMRFIPNSSFVTKRHLVLGTNTGALVCDHDMQHVEWVTFNNALKPNFWLILLSFLSLLLMAAFVVVVLRKRDTQMVQIAERKKDLMKRTDDLMRYVHLLDEDETRILTTLKQVDSIAPNRKKRKALGKMLKAHSLEIARINRRIALRIPKRLNEQIQLLEKTGAYDSHELIEASRNAIARNEVEQMNGQIKANDEWINTYDTWLNRLSAQIETYRDCAEIHGVNEGLFAQLYELKERIKRESIDAVLKQYAALEVSMAAIASKKASQAIQRYFKESIAYLERKANEDHTLSFLREKFVHLYAAYGRDGNLRILKELYAADRALQFLHLLDEIAAQTSQYKALHDTIIKENSTLVKKRFDKELAMYVAEKTLKQTQQINRLIKTLYTLPGEEERKALTDILKFSNTEGQSARVLALLIADPKVKRSLIPGMLGIYGNLNPVISRLISERIRPNKALLEQLQHAEEGIRLFIYKILRLLD